jgi:hypothetical protein
MNATMGHAMALAAAADLTGGLSYKYKWWTSPYSSPRVAKGGARQHIHSLAQTTEALGFRETQHVSCDIASA